MQGFTDVSAIVITIGNKINFCAEMSVKSCIGLEKFLELVFLFVYDKIGVAEIIRFVSNSVKMFMCYAKLAA